MRLAARAALALDAGIARSEVDLVRRTVRIAFTPGGTSLRRFAECLASLGYEPLLDAERLPAAMPPLRRALYLKIGVAGFAFGNMMLFSIPRYANGAPLEPQFQRLFDVLNLAVRAAGAAVQRLGLLPIRPGGRSARAP